MLNKVMLIGNLGQDPEIKYIASGNAVCNFSLATNERWTSKDGKREERTEWHRIVAWGKTAELCAEYLAKGRTAYIEGKLQTREWQDKDGNKRYTTEIVANTVQFLGSRSGDGQASRPASSASSQASSGVAPMQDSGPAVNDMDDDIPF